MRRYSVLEVLHTARHLDKSALLEVLEEFMHEADYAPLGRKVRSRVEREDPARLSPAVKLLDRISKLSERFAFADLEQSEGREVLAQLLALELEAQVLFDDREPLAVAVYDDLLSLLDRRSRFKQVWARVGPEERGRLDGLVARVLACHVVLRPFDAEMFELINAQCVRAGLGVDAPLMTVARLTGMMSFGNEARAWLEQLTHPHEVNDAVWLERWVSDAERFAG